MIKSLPKIFLPKKSEKQSEKKEPNICGEHKIFQGPNKKYSWMILFSKCYLAKHMVPLLSPLNILWFDYLAAQLGPSIYDMIWYDMRGHFTRLIISLIHCTVFCSN